MRNVPRHARSGSARSRRPARPVNQQGTSTPLRRAAQAAYTRSDRTIPFERRAPARQTYWVQATRRALEAALDPSELSGVIAAHSQYDYDASSGMYRCVCGWYLTRDWQEHTAAVIRSHLLGGSRSGSLPWLRYRVP
ncbi:hypothetical protein AB1046_14985 [Promicromonospora sp. Populi]|uniref:hypothetical protein n=1 Tax=Promicromonospora sp. Populi TaxID=3239420 RepID=UPI0034E20BFB